jgi:hypothetical protein
VMPRFQSEARRKWICGVRFIGAQYTTLIVPSKKK